MRRHSFTPFRLILGLTLLSVSGTAAKDAIGQTSCPEAAGQRLAEGWARYENGQIDRAGDRFQSALTCDPALIGARVGLGYVALREAREADARRWFVGVVSESPDDVDALLGLGYLARRSGDIDAARARFDRVLEIDPGNPEALRGLDQLATAPAPFVPIDRPPLVRPDTLAYPARVSGERFEVRGSFGWSPFFMKGVNLGAALPGKHPSEFPDAGVYARWIGEIAGMGANTIRLYTIHPPHFYTELERYNLAHADRPLWIVHGVWTELPPDDDYEDPEWEGGFFGEMGRVVDVVHGRADIEPRPGHASGGYTADVSQWVLAYIIGREWEPFSVRAYNEHRPDRTSWDGRYMRVVAGSPMEVWLAKACEEIVAYEVDAYNAQRPVAYTNWPTLDPLTHATETTVEEELRIRRALGETVERPPREYDNDAIGLDAMKVTVTDAFPAGHFASFHAYPYYPDFMVLDADYGRARSYYGRSNYFGYLVDLKRHHTGMPVVIAEYGVPASLGIAHVQPQGWHHGGHDEAAMAAIDARMTREIVAAGMAGALVFAWIDEWFKKNWIVIDFEIPLDRNRLWLNRLDAEQQYGMFAMEPEPAVPGVDAGARGVAWRSIEPLYASDDGGSLRAAADEAYLWLRFGAGDAIPEGIVIGFDVVDPLAGDFCWPGCRGSDSPVGLEFALEIDEAGARLVADPSANPWRIAAVRSQNDGVPETVTIDVAPPAGMFAGRFEQRFNRPFRPQPNRDGVYEPLRVVTNRPRFGRDGREFAALGYDRGWLPAGSPPDGLWERVETSSDGAIEVRIPWTLLNVTDPSRRRVLYDTDPPGEDFGTVTVDGVRIVAAYRLEGRWRAWPSTGSAADVALFAWPTWETPRWIERRRPTYDAMRDVFEELDGWPHGTESAR